MPLIVPAGPVLVLCVRSTGPAAGRPRPCATSHRREIRRGPGTPADYRGAVAHPTHRSLADDIRGRCDDELTELLLARPDLARPTPADLTALAARLGTRASTQRAVDSLDRGRLSVLEALAVAPDGADVATLAELTGADPATVEESLELLWSRALVWASPDGLRLVRTVLDVLGPHPAGLGQPAPHDPLVRAGAPAIRAAAASAPAAARAVLDRLVWGPPTAVRPSSTASPTASDAVRWLLDHGLLLPSGDDEVTVAREVGLALRAGRSHRDEQTRPPSTAGIPVTGEPVDADAGARAMGLLVLVDELVDAWGAQPPRVLRTGGLSVRDLTGLARALDIDQTEAAFVAELAVGAGLVADDGEAAPSWTPTAAYDEWQDREPGDRWAALVVPWWRSTRAAHLIGRAVDGHGPVNALGPDVHWPPVRGLRHAVLGELAALPVGSAPSVPAIVERLVWRRPRRLPADVPGLVTAVLAEGGWLGVTSGSVLTAPGRALVRGDDGLATAVAPHLPPTVDHVILQADLTAVAPGPLATEPARFLRTTADIESRGGATVHRFSEGSLRRGLDLGWTADHILTALRDLSTTPVPQPLEYLVRDVARRHGRARVGRVGSYVRSDDPALLDELLTTRALSMLQLERIAPTVVVSPVDAATVLDLLRENGSAPVAEGAGGAVVHSTRVARRVTRHTAAPPVVSRPVDDALVTEVVSSMRAGEERSADRRRTAEETGRPALSVTDPTSTLALLRDAIADRRAVWVGHVDAIGDIERFLLHPERVDGGRVTGTVEGSRRVLSVHRISGATPA